MTTILPGIILLILGLLLRWMAMRQLRQCFSLHLQPPSHIVTTGLYRHVRHPCYLGSLMALSGLALICIQLAMVYLAFVFFLSRIIEEENIILQQHPGIYQNYRATTPMLLPKLRFKKKGASSCR